MALWSDVVQVHTPGKLYDQTTALRLALSHLGLMFAARQKDIPYPFIQRPNEMTGRRFTVSWNSCVDQAGGPHLEVAMAAEPDRIQVRHP
jgi:hypothetical protein